VGGQKNLSGKYKNEKERLLAITDDRDIKPKSFPLYTADPNIMWEANEIVSTLR
jgi:hypothetical protein